MTNERKPVPPMWAVWNETVGVYEVVTQFRVNAERRLISRKDAFENESFRLVKLVESALEDGGDVS